MPGGGGGGRQCLVQKKFPSRVSFKIKGPRLAKNVFPEISACHKKSARILALKFRRLKNYLLAFVCVCVCVGGGGGLRPARLRP